MYLIQLFGKELTNLKRCIKTNWLSSNGEFNKKFERKFSKL